MNGMLTMCVNTKCKARDSCFRFVAKSLQPGAVNSLFGDCTEQCKHFIDLKRAVDDGVIDPLGLYAMLERIVKGEENAK